MDGTLVDVSGIKHYILEEPADFDAFHKASIESPEYPDIANAVRAWNKSDCAVVIVTARNDRYLYETLFWLKDHDIEHDAIYMRDRKDGRPDRDVKTDILSQIRRDGYDPILAYDDNPSTITVWQDNNIPVVICPGW
jgi:hypothetical protein